MCTEDEKSRGSSMAPEVRPTPYAFLMQPPVTAFLSHASRYWSRAECPRNAESLLEYACHGYSLMLWFLSCHKACVLQGG